MSSCKIDFFLSEYTQQTQSTIFWLSDKEPLPAYIHQPNDDEAAKVILVKNEDQKTINFHPIDRCVKIPKNAKRCDCMLEYNRTIHFIELKNRKDVFPGQEEWVSDGLSQIVSTISVFSNQVHSPPYKISTCYLANRQLVHQLYTNQILDAGAELGQILNHMPIIEIVSDQEAINV